MKKIMILQGILALLLVVSFSACDEMIGPPRTDLQVSIMMNPDRVFHTDGIQITLTASRADAHIYYTIDGSNPMLAANDNRIRYVAPFTLNPPPDAPAGHVRLRWWAGAPGLPITAFMGDQRDFQIFQPAGIPDVGGTVYGSYDYVYYLHGVPCLRTVTARLTVTGGYITEVHLATTYPGGDSDKYWDIAEPFVIDFLQTMNSTVLHPDVTTGATTTVRALLAAARDALDVAISWTAEARGSPTTQAIDFTFDSAVALTQNLITITPPGRVSVIPGALSGSGTEWSLAIENVVTPGIITISIDKMGITANRRVVVIADGVTTPTVHRVYLDIGEDSLEWFDIVEDGQTLPALPPNPTRENYNFDGWFTNADRTTPFLLTYPIIRDTTLYARWVPVDHTVTFNMGGAAAIPSVTVQHGGTVSRPFDPVRAGYTFGGWFANAIFTIPFDFTAPITANTTIFARWQAEDAILGFTGHRTGRVYSGGAAGYAWIYNNYIAVTVYWVNGIIVGLTFAHNESEDYFNRLMEPWRDFIINLHGPSLAPMLPMRTTPNDIVDAFTGSTLSFNGLILATQAALDQPRD